MPLAYAVKPNGLRSVGMNVFPYRVWYTIEEDKRIVVLLVVHEGRDPEHVERRLKEYRNEA
jgi:mRNA-degrading endonuclease RelE of RelBE toxin-antitoxin system